MAGARLTRREALATVAAVVGLTALAGCAPSWLDMDSELTERDLEVARNLGKSEDEIESMRESGRAGATCAAPRRPRTISPSATASGSGPWTR